MGNKKLINVKVDEELWRNAKSVAAFEGKHLNTWLEEAIRLKLKEK
jgi:predicted HicB family RNase H-like nuclease